jgi:hypothetical protein
MIELHTACKFVTKNTGSFRTQPWSRAERLSSVPSAEGKSQLSQI